jgi:hypothetical protein
MNPQLSPERKELINSFANTLRIYMFSQQPTNNDLKIWLAERFSMLTSVPEKLEISYEILKLNSNKIVDVYYLESIQSFFQYIQDYIKNEILVDVSKQKRSLAEIALQYVWEGKLINRQNKDSIANLFPELRLKNGNKLIQKFNFYSYTSNRINDTGDNLKNKRHLKVMCKTLPYLEKDEYIKNAENEINKFKKNVLEISGQIL